MAPLSPTINKNKNQQISQPRQIFSLICENDLNIFHFFYITCNPIQCLFCVNKDWTFINKYAYSMLFIVIFYQVRVFFLYSINKYLYSMFFIYMRVGWRLPDAIFL